MDGDGGGAIGFDLGYWTEVFSTVLTILVDGSGLQFLHGLHTNLKS